ncbi:RluA family pseudouridine synthase [Desulfurobacterium atlanticum]|uniref:23S rRNA pseudouridine1911/1915/1917 synthase n=1 Tax=Desulfurobacterium atlanticum TaxID=240169 RepID=A0A238Z361_9BACT|nr:RluA family pseudouridine synthase [Desulfurobacterium atlanticum]SNR77780.1 23S rRNA pseudouridine1911/1915/1917 synthase [Desulfurobacterium atlanticum]
MVFSSFLIRNRKGALASVITQVTGFSGKKVKRLIDEGVVSINGVKVRKRNFPLSFKDSVEFSVSEFLFQKNFDIEVLYEDEIFLVVNKPPFINTNNDKPDLEGILRRKYGNIYAVHRLDKQTSGAVIFVKDKKVFYAMVEIFKRKKITKTYKAVISGRFFLEKMLSFKLDGRDAVSFIKPVEIFENATLVDVRIETGRKHQIRRHLSMLGFPVAGEFLYWKKTFPFLLRFAPRIMLHSEHISFKSPVNGKRIDIKAPILEDFRSFLNVVRRGREVLPLKEYT